MKVIKSVNSIVPNGHYSMAVIHENLVFISGILPYNKNTAGTHLSVDEQADIIFSILDQILDTAGSSKYHVLKTTIYISDIALWDRVNSVYMEYFKDHYPARSIVPTLQLHFGAKLEMEVIACIP